VNRRNVRPHKPNENGTPIERFLVGEFSAAILEFAEHRLIQNAHRAVGKILTPVMISPGRLCHRSTQSPQEPTRFQI
jgi:hypothetical protein